MSLPDLSIIACGGVVGGIAGAVFRRRPAYGFGYGIASGLVISVANAVFGSNGFYGALGVTALTLLAEACKSARNQAQEKERIEQIRHKNL